MPRSSVKLASSTPLTQGKEMQIMNDTVTGTGTVEQFFTIDSDTVLFSVQATVVSGTLDIEVFTETPENQSVSILQFDQLSAPTSSLVLKEPPNSQAMQNIRVVVTHTGDATFQVRARGVARGQTTVKIQGSDSWKASQVDIGTTVTLLIPSSLFDRQGLVIRNWSTTGTLYIGATAAEAVIGNGYPIDAKAALGLDIQAGAEVYAVADAGTIDVRLLEAGF